MAERSDGEELGGGSEAGLADPLWRAAFWGALAMAALGGAVVAAQSEAGHRRLAAIFSTPRIANETPRPASPVRPAEAETQRLADAVQMLAADRDRLLARIEALERGPLVTGSIPRESAAPRAAGTAAAVAAPARQTANGPPAGSAAPVTVTVSPAPTTPPDGAPAADRIAEGFAASTGSPTESIATRTEFGVEIGSSRSIDGLRSLWAALRKRHASLLEGMRPVVAVRETDKRDAQDLRLVVGPLTDAAAAARLCAALTSAGVSCLTTVFDGQRLALR